MPHHEIFIHICTNCKQHEWCTRHKEATYIALAEELNRAIKNQKTDVSVHVVKDQGKLGSFEVFCDGVVLFSKLALGYFPHTTLLTTRIIQFIEDSEKGDDLQKYTKGFSPIKRHPQYMHASNISPSKMNNQS